MNIHFIGKSSIVAGLLAISAVAATAQTASRRPALPRNLTSYVGEYPVKLMKVSSVRNRLRSLLGKHYSDFDTSISVQDTMKIAGDFLFAWGCMPHLCIDNKAAFAIDLKNKRIHAAIYEEDAETEFFNEDKAPTPQILLDWVKELNGT